MTTKVYVIILVSCLGLFILGAVVNGILESSGAFNMDAIDPGIRTAVKVCYFILFLAIGFSFIPLMLKLFIYMQIRIGNGEFILIKFLHNHEQTVVYCAWGMCLLGLIIALPSAIRDGFFK
ncbi:MAG: hypothetical protein K4571_02730 [Deltaproteobacteria bacterium]